MARRLEPVQMAHGKMVQPALPHKMVRRHARVVAFVDIHATAVIPIMARFVVKMYPMDPSRMIAAQLVVLLAAMDTISQATAVWLMLVQMARRLVRTAAQRARNRRAAVVYGAARPIAQTAIHATARVPIVAVA